MRPLLPTVLTATVLAFWAFGVTGWAFHEDTPRLLRDVFAGLGLVALALAAFGIFAWALFSVLRAGQDALTGLARGRA